MIVATKRTCRTCPMVIADGSGSGQCRPCAARLAAVSEAVKPEPAPVRTPAKPRTRTCERDGHPGCEHVVALLDYLTDWASDMGMCPVCGGDDEPIQHKPDCLLALLIRTDAPSPERPGR